MSQPATDSTDAIDAIVLHEDDDVATALRPLAAGAEVAVRGPDGVSRVRISEDIPLCHKFALRTLVPRTTVRKYGEVIGEMTAEAAAGAHVHVHNLTSLRARRPSPA